MYFVLPPIILFFLSNFNGEYFYLLSRDMTEKEICSRKQFSQREKVKDQLIDDLTFFKKAMNMYKRLTRPNPKSVIDIAAKMEFSESHDGADKDIEGMGNQFSSSSSSSDDELPDFLKQRQMNVQYVPNGTVKMLAKDGSVIKEVTQEEFIKENPQFAQFRPTIQAQPPPGAPNLSSAPPQLQPQPPTPETNVVINAEGKGEFSSKYQERLDNDKQRKKTESQNDEGDGETIAYE